MTPLVHRSGILLLLAVVALVGCQDREKPLSGHENAVAWARLASSRNELRAYEGAPPVIPHGVAELGRESCMSCHAEGDAVTTAGGRRAPKTPHPTWNNCQQCHVEQKTRDVFQPSTFIALRQHDVPEAGQRLSPPYIPHRLQDRENCRACHLSPTAPPQLIPAHGDRTNCRQCHVQLRQAAAPFTPVHDLGLSGSGSQSE